LLGALLLLSGCTPPVSVAYLPDPTLASPGWRCPSDRKFIPHVNPPCAWVPGGLMFKSCWDRYIADISQARGCVRSPEAKQSVPLSIQSSTQAGRAQD